jgi:hypothetical protein
MTLALPNAGIYKLYCKIHLKSDQFFKHTISVSREITTWRLPRET